MVSMKDIANRLGISRCTVSNILNEKLEGRSYKKETIELVKKTAEEMGYVSNTIAQSLKTGSTKTIAIVVPDFANPFYINIVKEVESRANQEDFNLIVCMTEEKLEKEEKVLKMLQSRMVDGILISPVSYTDSLKQVENAHIVCFDRCVRDCKFPRVVANNEEATRCLTKKVLDRGVESPLFLVTSRDDYTIKYRVKGYKKALSENGCEIREERILYDVFNEEQAYDTLMNLPDNITFDSVILSTNYVVYGVIRALKERNCLEIPMGGFDDFPGSGIVDNNMIIARMPEKEFGALGYKKLFELIKGKKTADTTVKVIF